MKQEKARGRIGRDSELRMETKWGESDVANVVSSCWLREEVGVSPRFDYARGSLTERPPRKEPAPTKAMRARMSVAMIQLIQAKAVRALVELQ